MSYPSETDFLAALQALSKSRNEEIIGSVADQDDAAVVRVSPDRDLVIATDFIRGRGFTLFQLGLLNYFHLGYYCVAANVSDVAAMGASPTAVLSIIRYGRETSAQQIEDVARGIESACLDFGCSLIGGDSGSYDVDVLAGTALGFVPTGRALTRKGLTAGDVMYVSGDLGRPIAAIHYFSHREQCKRIEASHEEDLLRAWRQARPRHELGTALRETGLVRSCMDISDGLTTSLSQLRRLTGLGFRVLASSVPLAESVRAAAAVLDVDPYELGMGPSVDFELLFSVAAENEEQFDNWAEEKVLDVTKIGTAHSAESIFVRADGEITPLPGPIWDHRKRIHELLPPRHTK